MIRIGMDIGATKTKILMLTPQGEIIARSKIPTDSDADPAPIVARAAAEIAGLISKNNLKRAQVQAVAVGICGFQNPRTGLIDLSPNLHWYNVPFKGLLQKATGLPVYMANDVNAAAWGEFVYGAGRGCSEMAAVFIGSGIGGGLVSHGLLVEGGTGTAGEVGHMIFRVNGLKCDCGRRGCFEAYGGGMPMERRMRKAARAGKSPGAMKLVKNDVSKINTRIIRLAAEAGDRVAKTIWKDAEESLATLCADLVSLLNPDRLIIGGGVLEGNPGLLKTIQRGLDTRAVALSVKHVSLLKSALGDDAVAMGAAALVDMH